MPVQSSVRIHNKNKFAVLKMFLLQLTEKHCWVESLPPPNYQWYAWMMHMFSGISRRWGNFSLKHETEVTKLKTLFSVKKQYSFFSCCDCETFRPNSAGKNREKSVLQKKDRKRGFPRIGPCRGLVIRKFDTRSYFLFSCVVQFIVYIRTAQERN